MSAWRDLEPGQASPHFSVAELACRCGCGRMPPHGFVVHLEVLRAHYARPMPITSGARCPEHNARVSSTGRTGPHTVAAVDVAVSGADVTALVEHALRLGWTGIGLHQRGAHAGRFVHLDRLPQGPFCPRPRFWTY